MWNLHVISEEKLMFFWHLVLKPIMGQRADAFDFPGTYLPLYNLCSGHHYVVFVLESTNLCWKFFPIPELTSYKTQVPKRVVLTTHYHCKMQQSDAYYYVMWICLWCHVVKWGSMMRSRLDDQRNPSKFYRRIFLRVNIDFMIII